ncbi:MAG TPA: multidrug efflux SMR transporter [Bacillota bacterium]|nr:multidrug efflux SMR transporter [Bacillota bacterium]
MRGYMYLLLSIVFEVAGSAFLKLSEGFTVAVPSVLLIIFYGCSFVLLVLALKTISLSISYSIWAGLGTAGAAIVGSFVFNEKMSTLNMFGLLVIITGVVLMNVDKRDEAEEVSSHV